MGVGQVMAIMILLAVDVVLAALDIDNCLKIARKYKFIEFT
jgi:hypothetical protein